MSFLVLLAAAARTCDPAPHTRSGVLLTERRWVAALEERDMRALDCILGAGFADRSWHGELIPRAEVLKRLPSRPPSSLKLSALKATLAGDRATVRGVNTQTSGTTVIGSVHFVDVFVYREGRWQAVFARETLVKRE